MKISYKWLQEFVEIDKTPEELAELLTAHSFEVEGIVKMGEGLDKVVVGEVVFKDKHPDADKLSVTKVKISESETLDIVCGAPNVEAGQKVAVALVGAELPNGMKIEERKVRGEKSCGMICAEDELGLGKNHEGIMVLDADLKVGTPIVKALGLDDAVLEIDVLPNRAHDCLCHMGVAREVAALSGKKLKGLEAALSLKTENKNDELEVDVREKGLCRRYSAGVVKGVEVKESPELIKSRLASIDLRPINNIVDITNCIMFAYGQPMHAFDADKLNGKIIVRKAKKGEKILALDDKEYELLESDLVIADEEKPIAIAGVIGGKDTSVTAETGNIIFESANFYGTGVRKTAQRLKLFTDSSYRFEREIDPEITTACLQEAIKIAEEFAGGKAKEDVIDIYFEPRKERKIEFDYGRIENLLGINISKDEVLRILNSLDFEAVNEGERINVTIPTFRIDVEKVNDVIEEIARIYGYANIGSKEAEVGMVQVRQNKDWEMERETREIWKGLGFSEVYNYSFIGEKDIELFGLGGSPYLELRNYLSEDAKIFRTSLIPRLVGNVGENLKYRDEVMIFEIGRVAFAKENDLPLEKKYLSGALASKIIKKEQLFYAGKGKIEAFFESLGFRDIRCESMENPGKMWHPGQSAIIIIEGKPVGEMGVIHPEITSESDIEERIFCFEIDHEEIAILYKESGIFTAINKMPVSEFDLAIIVDKSTEWREIKETILGLGEENIVKIFPFDVYEGENIGEDKKSIAFKVVCQAEDRTLGDEEIKGVMDRIIEELKKIGGEIRK